MRLHYLQHVPYENIGSIEAWARKKGHSITKTVLYYDEALPGTDSFDWLVVMGGPMNVYEEREYPFLRREKKLIADAVRADRLVLGVCLGAQLIAEVAGGKVTANGHKEIGWHKVSLTPDAMKSTAFKKLPAGFVPFHWHGDTFSIPPGAAKAASSEACENQAFFMNDGRVVGLQFHLECTEDGINRLCKNCGDDLKPGMYVQASEQMLGQDGHLRENYQHLCALLDGMESVAKH
jgi:GMP synthase-like glutamine amidotransferase